MTKSPNSVWYNAKNVSKFYCRCLHTRRVQWHTPYVFLECCKRNCKQIAHEIGKVADSDPWNLASNFTVWMGAIFRDNSQAVAWFQNEWLHTEMFAAHESSRLMIFRWRKAAFNSPHQFIYQKHSLTFELLQHKYRMNMKFICRVDDSRCVATVTLNRC